MTVSVSSNFDAGAIEVVSIEPVAALESAQPGVTIRVNLRPDNASSLRQWFYCRLQGVAGLRCRVVFGNCAGSAYPEGWPGYQVVSSVDRQSWVRLPDTRYENGQLSVEFSASHDSVYLAYFEPYSWERHLDLLARVGSDSRVRIRRLGASVEGRDMDLVSVGSGPRQVWVIARQHPGETMAEWFVEGMLGRLLDVSDSTSRELLQQVTFNVVPNMNPDGSVRGNLRTNAAGANLNREWMTPDASRSPEVLCVREAMHRLGVDFFLDVHGDETLPYVFIDGSYMLPGRTAAAVARERHFIEAVRRACPDFQTEQGYPSDRFDEELLTLASKYVGHTFGCLSATLEMPFKDNANRPDVRSGWSGARSAALGAQMLDAVLEDVRGSV